MSKAQMVSISLLLNVFLRDFVLSQGRINYFCNDPTGSGRCKGCLPVPKGTHVCPTNVVAYRNEDSCLPHCNPIPYVRPTLPIYFCQAPTGSDRCGRCNPPDCPIFLVPYQSEESCLANCNWATFIIIEPINPPALLTEFTRNFGQTSTGFNRCRRCTAFDCFGHGESFPSEELCLADCNPQTFVRLVQPIFARYFCRSPTGFDRCVRCTNVDCPENGKPYPSEELCLADCNPQTFVEPIFPRYFCQAPTGIDRCRGRCITSECPTNVLSYKIEGFCRIRCNSRTFVPPIFPRYFCQAPVGFDRCRRCIGFDCPTNVLTYHNEYLCLANCDWQTFNFVQP